MMLDVLTLNLWNVNPPLDQRMRALATYLREQPCDVLLLQEVAPYDSPHVGSGGTWAHRIAREAGLAHVAYRSSWRSPEREEGLAICSRDELSPVRALSLPVDEGRMPRALLTSRLSLGDGDAVTLATTHLAYRLQDADLRRRQATTIVTALSDVDDPVVLGGDLNDVPGSPALAVLAEAGLRDATAGTAAEGLVTWDATNPWIDERLDPDRRIDHVLVRGKVQVSEAAVVLDGRTGPRVSDHHGVRVRLDV